MTRKRTNGESDPGVLGNLPSTRPNRLGRRPAAVTTSPAPGATRKPSPAPGATRKPSPRSGPQAVRAGAPALDAPPPDEARESAPSEIELVGAVVRAAGKVTRIGVTMGGQIARGAVDRLPRGH